MRITSEVQPRLGPLPSARTALQLVVVVAAAAIVLRAPGLLAVAAPFLVALAVDLLAPRPDVVGLDLEVPAGRVFEGDDVEVAITVTADRGPRWCRVAVDVTPGLTGAGFGVVHDVRVGDRLVLPGVASRWGTLGVRRVAVEWRSPLGTLSGVARQRRPERPLRVHPHPTALRELLRPHRTGAWAGARPAHVPGRGIEFAELRPFAAGDLPRDVSWPVTARRGEPWVAARHPERSTDVVLLLDAFDPDALEEVVRSAVALLEAHLRDRDRVGVLGLSGVLRWVPPGGGERHRHRVLDLLLRTQVVASWATRDLGTVPAAALPPGALVVALTRLGPEMSRAVADLRARGRDVVVVDLTPPPVGGGDDELASLARRLVALRQDDARDRLRRLGATVVTARADELPRALATAAAVRRRRSVPT